MTTSTQTILDEFEGDGTSTTFATSFPFLDAADLVVTVDSAVQTLGSNYSVTGGDGSTGSVVFTTAPLDGTAVVIRREVAATQPLDLTTNDAFPANSLERALDRLTHIAQQLKHSLLRTLRVSDTDDALAVVSLSAQSGKFLKVNAGGTGLDFVAGTPTDPQSTDEQVITATAGQIEFNLAFAYTPGADQLSVYKAVAASVSNGLLRLVKDVHYTETDSDTVTLLSGAGAGDVLVFRTGEVHSVTLLSPVKRERTYTLSAGDTTVTSTLSYTPGNNEITAFLNGAKLRTGVDFTETNSTTITLNFTAADGDEFDVIYGQGFDPASLDLTQADLGEILYPPSPAEITAGVTILSYHYPYGWDQRYGAVGNGTVNDRAALQATLDQWVAGGATPRWRARTYNIGSLTGQGYALLVNAKTRGVIEASGAKLVAATGDTSITTILRLQDCADVAVNNLTGTDTAYTSGTSQGAVLVDIVATAASDAEIGNITLNGVVAEACNSHTRIRGNAVGTGSTNQSNRIRGVHFGPGCKAEDCGYGVHAQNHGDFVTGRLELDGVRHATAFTGVVGFDLDVYSRAAVGSSDHVGIYAFDRSAGKGRVRLFLDTPAATPVPFALGFQNTTQDETITDLDLEFHSTGFPTSAPVLRMRALDAGSSVRTTTDNRFDNIRLYGDVSSQTAAVSVTTTQNVEGRLILDPSCNMGMDVTDPEIPGFVILQGDAEIRVKKGDLTSGNMFVVPLARYDGLPFALQVDLYAHADSASATAAHAIKSYILHGYNASAGAVTLTAATSQYSYYRTTDPTVTFTASGENVNVTLTGAGYNNAAAVARMTVRKLARFA